MAKKKGRGDREGGGIGSGEGRVWRGGAPGGRRGWREEVEEAPEGAEEAKGACYEGSGVKDIE